MRAGLRLRILVLLGGLLVVAFVPLYFAVATYTTLAVRQVRLAELERLGQAMGGHLLEARGQGSAADVARVAAAQSRMAQVHAVGVYEADRAVLERGEATALAGAAAEIAAGRASARELWVGDARALRVVVVGEGAGAALVLGVGGGGAPTAPLLRLLGLYTLLVALALLVLSYFALTRLIVRPLDELTRSAERVAGGARRWLAPQTSVRELSELGRSLGTMTEKLLRDEEALRRKIDEVEAATHDLAEAQQRLVRSERLASVGRLSAGLAHEIGNPIAALIGMQELLLAGGLTEAEQRDFVERMRRETERIHRILRDLLQFARPTAKTADEPLEPGDLGVAIGDTVALVAPQRSLKDVSVFTEVEAGLPPVTLSREHTIQVLLNLVLNAADAAGAGGRIVIRARRVGDRLRLEVEDDGPGVAAAVRERLFEPFVTTKDVGRGTGLGLAVCRGLVEAAGGTIALDDAPNGGARFVVELPLVPV